VTTTKFTVGVEW